MIEWLIFGTWLLGFFITLIILGYITGDGLVPPLTIFAYFWPVALVLGVVFLLCVLPVKLGRWFKYN